MPKIIKDVEKIIRNCAIELFIEFSYINVDMKMIAQRSGVAVGTLYNYYENKKQLYLSILTESWQNTFAKLDAVNELTVSSDEKLRKFIRTLYEDIEARNGLGKALVNNSVAELRDDEEVRALKNSLTLRAENLFKCINKPEALAKCFGIDTRLAESLIVSTLAMIELHPNDKEDNIKFLVEFASLSVE